MEDFEALLAEHRGALERYVFFRMDNRADAEDVVQETCLAAFRRFGQLRSRDSFKAWLLAIARAKCADHYRRSPDTVSLDALPPGALVQSRHGRAEAAAVRDTLASMADRDRELLRLCYYEELPQREIARRLGIPLGTVKSRLSAARGRFRDLYPFPPKGEILMQKKMPDRMPDYTIVPSGEPPFPVKWEELMGWFLVPREGERLSWAMYDFPERTRGEYVELEAKGRAEIHGIEGVIVRSKEYDAMPCNRIDETGYAERMFVAQLTDTHCRFLAESHETEGVMRLHTFLDGDEFLPNWGFGEDNCGNETNLAPKGDIRRQGSAVTTAAKPFLLDVVGRYTVTIGGKSWDTVCVMDVETYDEGMATEQFLDRNGRTVLWRRFNRDDWRIESYKTPWSERLPENEKITVNGQTYVHWYDCITSYIL